MNTTYTNTNAKKKVECEDIFENGDKVKDTENDKNCNEYNVWKYKGQDES